MAASVSFLNSMLDGGITEVASDYTGIWVGLYSGGAVPLGNYSHQYVSAWNAASNSTKAATARVNFAPTGSPQGGFPYDEIRLYGSGTGLLLHSISVIPAQFIANLDIHQILVQISGS